LIDVCHKDGDNHKELKVELKCIVQEYNPQF